MRLVFLGTPEPGVVALRALVAAGHDVRLVITRADARRHRNQPPEPSPVGALAAELGLPVSHRTDDAATPGAELGVVVAYGRLIKPPVLAALPMVNVHFSLLPRWRGAAPVERAILEGDTETGVCLMEVEEGLDTGGVYRCRAVPIGEEETADELRVRLSEIAAGLLVSALAEGLGEPEPQQGEPTYAAKIEPAELELDWSRSTEQLRRVVRLGRAWTTWRGKRLLVLAATGAPTPGGPPGTLHDDVVTTGNGGLRLLRVQPEGRAPLDAGAWLRGGRPRRAERLGE